MTIEWIRDAELPEEILAQMERAASGAPACEGIHVPCSIHPEDQRRMPGN